MRWMVIKVTIEGNRSGQGSKKYVTRYEFNLLKMRLLTGCSAEDSGQGPSRQEGEEKQKEQSFQGVFTQATQG